MDFAIAERYMEKVIAKTNQLEIHKKKQYSITRTSSNAWKLEYSIKFRSFQVIRIKFYVKTEEELTSCGVAVSKVRDPLVSLLCKNYENNQYKRRIFSDNGLVITRLECSFYIGRLHKPKCYK